MSEALKEFWTECEDLVEKTASLLPALEKGEAVSETLDSIYRDIHTIKGSAQLFGVNQVGTVAHTLETSLGPVRDEGAPLTPQLMELLYSGVSVLDKMIIAFRDQDEEALNDLKKDIPAFIELSLALVGGNMSTIKDVPAADASNASPAPASAPTAAPVIENKKALAPTPEAAQEANAENSSTIRVPVGLLDKLMTLMGEMVLVRNQVLQYSSRSDDLEFLNLSQRLDVVTSEIQSEMMKTRMQPIGNILTKFQRLVRDLGKELGKKIDLELFGTETELDKTLLEAVKDPLTHIIRNACDHGMELPEVRRQAGKPENGRISVRAFHEGGQVIIEISDNGRGLHREVLLNKALEKGLITRERAATMSERETFGLIFMPGFSTAAKVTNISGRGVGMDVVRSNIDKIGGMVEIQSKAGEGTTISLKIPLTLAIVPAMIVSCGQDRYAIPQVKLVELLRVEAATSENKIEYLQGKAVLRLRGKLLPLVYLKQFLGFPVNQGQTDHELPAVANIVVLRSESQMFGLIVDEIQDTADIVVKPLNRFLKSLNVYSGATVLGDGSVALILDVLGIAHRMMLTAGADSEEAAISAQAKNTSEQMQEFLLFRLDSPAKHAIPLDLVHRLEEFKRSELEISGGQRVVRYRDQILPILSLNEYLGYKASEDKPSADVLPVIVTQKSNRYYGIEVNEILDVLKTENEIDEQLSDRDGILGTLISGSEVVVVVESLRMLEDVTKSGPALSAPVPTSVARKILYVEDNAFFRRHVSAVLKRAGYEVSTANSGVEALDRLESATPGSFDIVLSDIEMPRMNGLKLAENIRQNGKWKHVPLIALTTKYDQKNQQVGLAAGFDLYLEKLNAEELVTTLSQVNPRRVS